ncbi:MAG TPA: TPM domain-containing protein [Xanthomonadaceae bacterium]|nr:TPM domain-containing protein [Xanthomonadaceae bacterium]
MRLLRHLFAPSAQRLFPADALQRITDAIAAGEARHRGEVCFAVEPALHWRAVLAGVGARQAAEDAFARLRVWDTAGNNGVLLYLLLADHRIEIVADRGLRGLVEDAQWRAICARMEERLRAGEAEAAVTEAVVAISDLLAAHFPLRAGDRDEDELPNRPRIL